MNLWTTAPSDYWTLLIHTHTHIHVRIPRFRRCVGKPISTLICCAQYDFPYFRHFQSVGNFLLNGILHHGSFCLNGESHLCAKTVMSIRYRNCCQETKYLQQFEREYRTCRHVRITQGYKHPLLWSFWGWVSTCEYSAHTWKAFSLFFLFWNHDSILFTVSRKQVNSIIITRSISLEGIPPFDFAWHFCVWEPWLSGSNRAQVNCAFFPPT